MNYVFWFWASVGWVVILTLYTFLCIRAIAAYRSLCQALKKNRDAWQRRAEGYEDPAHMYEEFRELIDCGKSMTHEDMIEEVKRLQLWEEMAMQDTDDYQESIRLEEENER